MSPFSARGEADRAIRLVNFPVPIPNQTVRYFQPPEEARLQAFLHHRFPAMPAHVRNAAIKGWFKVGRRTGYRHKDGTVALRWEPSFSAYANACWAKGRLRG